MIYTNYKEIDGVGRIVISKDIRKYLNIMPGDVLKIEASNQCITIEKAENKCVFCNSDEKLKEFSNKYICQSCLDKLNN